MLVPIFLANEDAERNIIMVKRRAEHRDRVDVGVDGCGSRTQNIGDFWGSAWIFWTCFGPHILHDFVRPGCL